jgi:hypothetical protein
MRTHVTQKGITMIGFAIMLCVVGFFAYGAMKLIPLYTEYYGVVKSMKSLQTKTDIATMPIERIRRELSAIFSVQYVSEVDVPPNSIQLITQDGQHSLRVAYSVDVPFIYNIDLLVHFDKTVDLSHGASY